MEHLKKPDWLKVKLNSSSHFNHVKNTVETNRLNTVCEEARCPNIHECWGEHGTATFMILGDTCTRRCRFCAVSTGLPKGIDELEPIRVAESVHSLKLKHVVITMVNRDELEDGGARILAHTVHSIKKRAPGCSIELLTSDFMGKASSIKTVMDSKPDIMSHNLETIERLTPFVRSRSSYARSLEVLKLSRDIAEASSQDELVQGSEDNKSPTLIIIKSSMMLGLGEHEDEVKASMHDLFEHGVQVLNLGQYLQPTKQHLPVKKYWSPEEFKLLKDYALEIGFSHCEAAPLVRSSYHAGLSYEEIRRNIHPLYTKKRKMDG